MRQAENIDNNVTTNLEELKVGDKVKLNPDKILLYCDMKKSWYDAVKDIEYTITDVQHYLKSFTLYSLGIVEPRAWLFTRDELIKVS